MHQTTQTHYTLQRACPAAGRYQNTVHIVDNNIKQNPHYYKLRQAIVEHPFGTIKFWGSLHQLQKELFCFELLANCSYILQYYY